MSLSHARHNKEACEHLLQSGKFNDWVITTAYYSALHYANYELFPKSYAHPRTGNVKNYSCFDEYYNDRSIISTTKHGLLLELVEDNMDDEVSEAFSSLKELCWTARYENYDQDVDLARESYNNLLEVSEFCEPLETV